MVANKINRLRLALLPAIPERNEIPGGWSRSSLLPCRESPPTTLNRPEPNRTMLPGSATVAWLLPVRPPPGQPKLEWGTLKISVQTCTGNVAGWATRLFTYCAAPMHFPPIHSISTLMGEDIQPLKDVAEGNVCAPNGDVARQRTPVAEPGSKDKPGGTKQEYNGRRFGVEKEIRIKHLPACVAF